MNTRQGQQFIYKRIANYVQKAYMANCVQKAYFPRCTASLIENGHSS
jgi:hypothetical protein